jgi:hypothetical protein
MPIPPLDDEGFLPPGIHDCTLEEVGERFGTLRGSERRGRLFARLQDYVRDLRRTGLAIALLIDGSFVTGRPDPNDIDLVLVLKRYHDFTVDLRPFEYNTVYRSATSFSEPGGRHSDRTPTPSVNVRGAVPHRGGK